MLSQGCVELADYTAGDDNVLIFCVVLTASRACSVLADFLLIVVTVDSLGRGSVRERLSHDKHLTLSGILLWNGMSVVHLAWLQKHLQPLFHNYIGMLYFL